MLAFHDIAPQTPVHVLIIPKKHVENIIDAAEVDELMLPALMRAAAAIAKTMNLSEKGFRIVSNCGPDARQSVPHLHFHLLSGKRLSDAMG